MFDHVANGELQRAILPVPPAVVTADQRGRVAGGLQQYAAAAMAADVEQRVDATLRLADQHQTFAGDVEQEVVAGQPQLRLVAGQDPVPGKQAFPLLLEDRGIAVERALQ